MSSFWYGAAPPAKQEPWAMGAAPPAKHAPWATVLRFFCAGCLEGFRGGNEERRGGRMGRETARETEAGEVGCWDWIL